MRKPLLSQMTLKEKIGQCLVGFQSDILMKNENGSSIKRTEEEVRALLEKEQFGAFWAQVRLYKRQVIDLVENSGDKVMSADHKKFIRKEDECLKIHALTGIDAEQDGAGPLFADLTSVCTQPAVGAADSEELAYELGVAVARELRCAGVNWRWAPVVDIPSRFHMSIMRVYGDDNLDRIIKLSNAHIRGMQSEGVAGTAKHFPGHDRYEYRDGHFTSATIVSSMEEWWAEQGKVFQEVINGGVYSVMAGHTGFPAADDTIVNGRYIPATLSKKIITDLLKGEMGFKGVVVTDGIVMGALYSLYDYEELIVKLMNAGNDVLLGVQLNTGEILEKAVLDGRVAESRIDDACQRVLDMKEKLGLFEDDYFVDRYVAKDVVSKTRQVNAEIAKRSVTLVRDRNSMLPVDKKNIKNVTIICSAHVDSFFENLIVMKKEFEERGAKVRLQRRLSSSKELKEISVDSDLIIYAVYVAPHKPKGAMSLYDAECETYVHAFTSGKEKSIGLSMGYPYIHYDIMENADTFINTYGDCPASMKAFVEAVYGEIPIVGNSPVKLEPEFRTW